MKYIVTTYEKNTYLETYKYYVEAESEKEAEDKIFDLDYDDNELVEQYYDSGEIEEVVKIEEA
jgi:hypothetical protein